jgi:hypothetical protein
MKTVSILTAPVKTLRALTGAEARNLRALGVSCSTAWSVSPRGDGRCGDLFRPAERNTGAFATHAGIHALQAA